MERGTGWFKQGRHLAMCFEKTVSSYLGLALFAIGGKTPVLPMATRPALLCRLAYNSNNTWLQ